MTLGGSPSERAVALMLKSFSVCGISHLSLDGYVKFGEYRAPYTIVIIKQNQTSVGYIIVVIVWETSITHLRLRGRYYTIMDHLLSLIPAWATYTLGITAICGFLFGIYKVAKSIDAAVGPDEHGHTLNTRIAVIEKQIGVDEDGESISTRMTKVEYQIWPNGGKSVADRVNQANSKIDGVSREVAVIKDLLTAFISKP